MNSWGPRIAFAALVALTFVSGCGHKSTAYGVAESSSSWTRNSAEPTSPPGIRAASVTFVTLKAGPPEGVPFVVWSDLPNGSSGSGGGKVGGASYKGRHRAADGRRVEFHAETADGKTGTITIADVTYDLSDGSVFLVSTQQGSPQIAQIAIDPSDFPKGVDQLVSFAKSNKEIQAFFEKHGKNDEAEQ